VGPRFRERLIAQSEYGIVKPDVPSSLTDKLRLPTEGGFIKSGKAWLSRSAQFRVSFLEQT
jgi:hypothetical protein